MSQRSSADRGQEEGRARAARRAPTTPRLDPNARRPLAAADIAGLQRAVGNAAVTKMLGGGIVQRKNLEQTGWLSDLTPETATRQVVGDGRDVKVYKAERSTPAANKLEAFQKAAELNAHVGKTVDDKAESVWRIRGSNQKWTEKDVDELNKGSLNKIDPFFYESLVSFPKDDMTQYLGFMFQHAASYTGYVEAILDTSNPGAQGVPSMYDVNTESGLKDTEDTDKGRNMKFSNVHDLTGTTNLLTLSGSGGKDKNFDAYTKIAGEGARWQCVRKHAANLRDDTLFFTKQGRPGHGYVWGATFRSLWLSWAKDFGKKYDIDDAAVRSVILRRGSSLFQFAQNPLLSSLSSKDYDLDKGKSHS